MQTASAWSTLPSTEDAIESLLDSLQQKLVDPNHIFISYTAEYSTSVLLKELTARFPNASLHGSSTCRGVMTEEGHHSIDGRGMGVLAIRDPRGGFGTGLRAQGTDPLSASRHALEDALANAGRPGEVPEVILVSSAPGAEEEILRGIASLVGTRVPVYGGSSADNTISGDWSQFSQEGVTTDGVVVSVMFLSGSLQHAFSDGYSPTDKSARATRVDGRTLYELDHRPAAEVYDEWLDGALEAYREGGNILAATSLHPLGLQEDASDALPFYRPVHPESLTPDGAITVFANIPQGKTVTLLSGTPGSLIRRGALTTRSASQSGPNPLVAPVGAFITYCAGCMLTIEDDVTDVVDGIRQELGTTPFLGQFTFGEQGCSGRGENLHGNLMVSAVILGS